MLEPQHPLRCSRVSYYEHEAGKLAPRPKGTILLAEVFQCVPLPGASFSLIVGDPSARTPPVEYVMMAANDEQRREWVLAMQQAICRPLDAAQALQAMLSLQKQGALCTRAQELLRRWLSVGSPETLRQAKALMEICRGVRPAERCGDRVESFMVELAVADSEAALLAVMRGLTLIFVKEYAPPSLRDRLVRAAMVLYERSTIRPSKPPQAASGPGTAAAAPMAAPGAPGSATPPPPSAGAAPAAAATATAAAPAPEVQQYPWTPRVQQEFGLVLHAIALFDHAERMRQEAATRQSAARRAAEATGAPLLVPSDVQPDSDDFGLLCEEEQPNDECYSMCSCECAVCAEAERAEAETVGAPSLATATEEVPSAAAERGETAAAAPAGAVDLLAGLRQPRAFEDDYELGRRLGEGAYSTVFQVGPPQRQGRKRA